MNSSGRISRRYQELNKRFARLIDSDPAAAIREARALQTDDVLGSRLTEVLQAGVLVDAGAAERDRTAIEEGIRILRDLLKAEVRPDVEYELGNGLIAMADLGDYRDPNWHLETALLRQEARRLFSSAGQSDTHGDLQGRALTNLGNALVKSHRWLEGYDAYQRALLTDPTNVIAGTGAAKLLARRAGQGEDWESERLLSMASRLASIARGREERVRELAGAGAVKELASFIKMQAVAAEIPDRGGLSPYESFVARQRLALAPVLDLTGGMGRRFDTLRIRSVIQSIKARGKAPAIFVMFNSLKADYLAARYMAFAASEDTIPETGKYADTLDYAVYGVRESVRLLAQRAAFDLLDKIAVAATAYLGIADRPERVEFVSRWLGGGAGVPVWSEQIRMLGLTSNPGVIALSEIALDLQQPGFLRHVKGLRNAGTHRFVVARDFGGNAEQEGKFVEYYGREELNRQIVETLRLGRAALFYLVDLIANEEARKKEGREPIPPLHLPDHHWVRGEEE